MHIAQLLQRALQQPARKRLPAPVSAALDSERTRL
jgi:hypothetical protein